MYQLPAYWQMQRSPAPDLQRSFSSSTPGARLLVLRVQCIEPGLWRDKRNSHQRPDHHSLHLSAQSGTRQVWTHRIFTSR